jgi:replicative DNA helicase
MLSNHDAEKSVIGAILQDAACTSILGELQPSDFDKREHQLIFGAMAALHARKTPIDAMTLSDELQKRGELDVIGGTSYLIACVRWVPTTANIGSYVRIVAEYSRKRALYATLRESADKILGEMHDVDEIADIVRGSLKDGRTNGGIITFADATQSALDRIERRSKGDSDALKTGIPLLDHITNGLGRGQNIVIAGLTSAGKSAFAMEIGVNVAANGKKVIICSREMPEDDYMDRVFARKSLVDLTAITTGNIGDGQWEPLIDAASMSSTLKGGFLTDTMTVEALRGIVEADPPDLLIVDYLQLMETRKHTDSETVRVSNMSTAIKRLALDCNIPVLTLSQLSRQDDGRAALMPKLKDLKGSGNVEQDADKVIFLHMPEAPSDKSVPECDKELCRLCLASAGTDKERRYIIVNVAKNRQGMRSMFPMIFEPRIMRFTSIDRRAQ